VRESSRSKIKGHLCNVGGAPLLVSTNSFWPVGTHVNTPAPQSGQAKAKGKHRIACIGVTSPFASTGSRSAIGWKCLTPDS